MAYNIKHVIFDLDGTISDSKEGITQCMHSALNMIGADNIPAASSLDWCIGPPIEKSFATILNDNREERIAEAVDAYRYCYYEQKGELLDQPFIGMKAVLQQLFDAGYTLYVATLKPQHNAGLILERYGFAHYFSGVFGVEQNGDSDIKYEIIAHILKRYQLNKQEVAMIGDREFDLLGAKQNGVMAVAAAYGYGTPDEIQKTAPDAICYGPEDILGALSLVH